MAYFTRSLDTTNVINIIRTETVDNFTVYIIEVSLCQVRWTVQHRYSEFHQLHEKLVQKYKVNKTLLPPKKLFGNQSDSFISKRQKELTTYLQKVISLFCIVPPPLVDFLHFDKYEIHGLTQDLATELYHKGESLLAAGDVFCVSPLVLHALSTRLTLPEPTCETGDAANDIGHILDYFLHLRCLKIAGCDDKLGSSNIIPNHLNYDLTSFKSLHTLELEGCALSRIHGVDHIKKTLNTLHVSKTASTIESISLLDVEFGQWQGVSNEAALVPAWSSLTTAHLSHNNITAIDESVKLFPRVSTLDLSHNQLSDLRFLHHLSALTSVDLSYNRIHALSDLHCKLGNVKCINLAGNQLDSLAGFSRLYSLEQLDLSHNELSQVGEVGHLSSLPCLERLSLVNNPVTIVLDYRTRILEMFTDRARELELDGTRPSQRELDTVAVRIALNKAKQHRHKKHTKPPVREAAILDPATASGSRDNTPVSVGSSSTVSHDVRTDSTRARESLRGEVERLREQCGTAWLSLLNHAHQSSRSTSPTADQSQQASRSCDAAPTTLCDPSTSHDQSSSSTRSCDTALPQPEARPMGHQYNLLRLPADSGEFILPETLPGRNDTTLMSYLHSLTPDRPHVGRRRRVEEQPVSVLWCAVVRYMRPYRQPPACVYITTQCVHILEVASLSGRHGYPILHHLHAVPLVAIEQVVLGYQAMSLRLEETGGGPQGTFTLLTGSRNKTNAFLDGLKLAYRRAVADVDQYEDPRIVVSDGTENALQEVLGVVESAPSVRLYQLVHSVDMTSPDKPFITQTLVVTDHYMYLLREDYVLWPPPSFSTAKSALPQFEISAVFPTMGRITGVQMYDTDTQSPQQDAALSPSFSASNFTNVIVPNFIGFGVRLTFDLGKQGSQVLDIRVPTSGMRDKLLATFTQSRRDHYEKSPSPAKSKRDKAGMETTAASGGARVKCRRKRQGGGKAMRKSYPVDAVGVWMVDTDSDDSYQAPVETLVRESPAGKSSTTVESTSSESGPPVSTKQTSAASSPSKSSSDMETDSVDVMDAEDVPDPENNSRETESDSLPEESRENQCAISPSVNPVAPPMDPQLRTVTPPASLPLAGGYPSVSLLSQLTEINESLALPWPLSPALQQLSLMNGEELLNFFHSSIAQIGSAEELHHVLWAAVVNSRAPLTEAPMCVMLSTRAVYFVSDETPRPVSNARLEAVRTHARHRSDTYKSVTQSQHYLQHTASSGVIHVATSASQKVLRSYHCLPLNELKDVTLGLFDQSFRFTDSSVDNLFACVTRDSGASETFTRHLMSVLSLRYVSPSPEKQLHESGDFYSSFTKRSESPEFLHPSRVRFVYPSDDNIAELLFLINTSAKRVKQKDNSILLYLLVLQTNSDGVREPRSLVVTADYVALTREDYVSYPMPEFSRSIPDQPRWEVMTVTRLESLKRVEVNDGNELELVFVDDDVDIVVDASVEHFSPGGGELPQSDSVEVRWSLWIQCGLDKERLVKCLRQQWAEKQGEELVVTTQ